MTTTTTTDTAAPANPRSRVITASLVGTTIEFYDFYVYATAAVLVFPILFFPTGNDTTALLASFAVFGAAMIARPIGAVVFGHFGDRFGRKATLVASLLTMGIATFLIGVPAHLRRDRLVGGAAAAGPAPGAGLRARRRVVGRGARRDRERAGGQARLVRHLPAARRAARLHHRQRRVPRDQLAAAASRGRRPASEAFLDVGMARAVPVLRRHGHHRPVGAAAPRRVRDLREGRGEGRDPQVAPRRGVPPPLEAAHPRHVHHAGDLRAVLPDDELHALVRHEGRPISRRRPPPPQAAARGDGQPSIARRSPRSSIPASASATPTSCSCRSSAWCSSASSRCCPGPIADSDRPPQAAHLGHVRHHRLRPDLQPVPAPAGRPEVHRRTRAGVPRSSGSC